MQVLRVPERTLDTLELGLPISHLAWALGAKTHWGLLQEQCMLLTTEPSRPQWVGF